MARRRSGIRRAQIISDFTRGQREFFRGKQRREKELLGLEAGFEKDIRTTLANIAETGAMSRLLKEQEFQIPERGARLGAARQTVQQQIDDLRLGRKYAPRLLKARTEEAELGTKYLSGRIKELLGESDVTAGAGPTTAGERLFVGGPLGRVVRPTIMASRMMKAGLYPGQFVGRGRRSKRRFRATRGGSGPYRR